MMIEITHNNYKYKLNTKDLIDISIPYQFNNKQPNFYNVKPGTYSPLTDDNISYSVKSGASCNVFEIAMNIHCTGTHTEFVGHLLEDPGNIGQILNVIFIPSLLITVQPTPFKNTQDSYHCDVDDNEFVIDKNLIAASEKTICKHKPKALIIRSNPNSKKKKYFNYQNNIPPFFTNDALKYISDMDIEHLIVDIPSIDRMNDHGLLGNHRIFWNNGQNINEKVNQHSKKTITEMSYISNNIKDGFFFLNLQIPHFVCDAAPSRPLLIKAT